MDFDSICRICLENTVELKNIFIEGLDQYIMTFISVKVKLNDGLPQSICTTCIEELKLVKRFKEKCEQSHLKLYKYINSITETNNVEYLDFKTSTDSETILSANQKNILVTDTDLTICTEEIQTLYECALCKIQNPVPICKSCSQATLSVDKNFDFHDIKDKNATVEDEEIEDTSLSDVKDDKKSSKKFQCDTCGKIFTCKSGLLQHLTVHTNNRPFKCDECGKSFRLKSTLSKHLLCHSGVRNYHCIYCTRSFTLKSNLTSHMEIHSGEKKFTCHVCDKRFKTSRSLQYHLKLHTGERDFPCTKCDKAFVNKFDLRRHEERHEKHKKMEEGTYKFEQKPKKYQCEFCGTFCTNLSDLLRHLRVHSGDKPYKCEFCEKSFIGLSGLTVHARTHTGAKPFKCQYCDQYFSQRSNLNVHSRLHTGETLYNCDFCSKGYNRKRDLKAHVKKHFIDNE